MKIKNVRVSLLSNNETGPRMNDCLAAACCSVVSEEVMRYYWQTRQQNRYFAMTAEQQTAIREVGGRLAGEEPARYWATG